MARIKMNPIAEMDGDEMTRVIWSMIKEILLEPFVELNTEYYDLGLVHRDETDDRVTHDAAAAIKRLRVGVKCATITPNAQRVEEYGLRRMYKSPNGTIRDALDGTIFRTPITAPGIEPIVRPWKKPITVARHSYGDIYSAAEFRASGSCTAELICGDERKTVCEFRGPGILLGQYNNDESIERFARTCFGYALERGEDLWFSCKDTIAKVYDGTFRAIFERVYRDEFESRYRSAGISYFYTLIDDAVARVMRSEGGFVWALKNYDGDVMSDMISAAFGAMSMMTSVLVTPDGCFEYEAAHGTVTRHYYKWRQGEKTSTNPIATIYAWTGALHKRGELDGNADLSLFARKLEDACMGAVADNVMTVDLAALRSGVTGVDTAAFLEAVRDRL